MKKHRPRPRKPKNRKPPAAEPIGDTGPVYYHGGPPGLAIGSYILPRAETGARANVGAENTLAQDPVSMDEVRKAAGELDRAAGHADDATERTIRLMTPCDPTSVYITTSLRLAAWYAARYRLGVGSVYAVAPEGEIVRDPAEPHRRDIFKCDRARIVAVGNVSRLVQMMRDRVRRGFDNIESVMAFLDEQGIYTPSTCISDRIEQTVSELVERGFSPHAMAVALTAAATELMLKCSKRAAWEKAEAAWAGVIEGMNKRAAQRGASSAA